jgi:hypothetical protein
LIELEIFFTEKPAEELLIKLSCLGLPPPKLCMTPPDPVGIGMEFLELLAPPYDIFLERGSLEPSNFFEFMLLALIREFSVVLLIFELFFLEPPLD